MTALNEDFFDLLSALIREDADFLVVGAHALAVHGVARATGDLDILVRPDSTNAARVVAALDSFGAPLEAHGVTELDFRTPGTVYQLGLPPRRIDVMTRISGVTFAEASETRTIVEVQGLRVPFLGRDALLRNKKATGRDKDLLDAKLLEREPDGTSQS